MTKPNSITHYVSNGLVKELTVTEFDGHPRIDGQNVVVEIDGATRRIAGDDVAWWIDDGKTHMPMR